MNDKNILEIDEIMPGKYIVAVSGGVDSMVLLHLLVAKYESNPEYEFIVAHYDHGIRIDSVKDRELVQKIAEDYDLTFEYIEGKLGKTVSESQARDARYAFLRKIKNKHKADSIITAHHQDDAVETLIINIIRGTSRRGTLKETNEVKRPLLITPKSAILKYAKKHNLHWREDETNRDTKYLRNYVRNVLLPEMKERDPRVIEKLLDANSSLKKLNIEIDSNISGLIKEECELSKSKVTIPRHLLIMVPNIVGREIIYEAVRHLDKQSGLDKKNLEKLLVFSKTARVHKRTPINSQLNMYIEPEKIILELV